MVRRSDVERDLSGQTVDLLRIVLDIVKARDHFPHHGQEPLSIRRGHDAQIGTVEKLDADLFFKVIEQGAQRRLRDK